jgi:hypothetical protein
MSNENMIALILSASIGALAAAFATEYIVDKCRKIKNRIIH